jgi:hypothetical protein
MLEPLGWRSSLKWLLMTVCGPTSPRCTRTAAHSQFTTYANGTDATTRRTWQVSYPRTGLKDWTRLALRSLKVHILQIYLRSHRSAWRWRHQQWPLANRAIRVAETHHLVRRIDGGGDDDEEPAEPKEHERAVARRGFAHGTLERLTREVVEHRELPQRWGQGKRRKKETNCFLNCDRSG